jgi:hypothetical protein
MSTCDQYMCEVGPILAMIRAGVSPHAGLTLTISFRDREIGGPGKAACPCGLWPMAEFGLTDLAVHPLVEPDVHALSGVAAKTTTFMLKPQSQGPDAAATGHFANPFLNLMLGGCCCCMGDSDPLSSSLLSCLYSVRTKRAPIERMGQHLRSSVVRR